jgi:hypothetical protein
MQGDASGTLCLGWLTAHAAQCLMVVRPICVPGAGLYSNWCDEGTHRARQKQVPAGSADGCMAMCWGRSAGATGKAKAGAQLRLATPVRPRRRRRSGLASGQPHPCTAVVLAGHTPIESATQRQADAVAMRTQTQDADAIIAAGRACSAVVVCDTQICGTAVLEASRSISTRHHTAPASATRFRDLAMLP